MSRHTNVAKNIVNLYCVLYMSLLWRFDLIIKTTDKKNNCYNTNNYHFQFTNLHTI